MKLNKPRTLGKPQQDAGLDLTRATVTPALSAALSRVQLDVREPGTDITLGTTFYTPVLTLLARTLNTRREDHVFCAWPLLGCPYTYFENALPTIYTLDDVKQQRVPFKRMLDTQMMVNAGRPPVLHEIFDLLQSVCGWKMPQLAEWVRAVEQCVRQEHVGLLDQLQAMADQARKQHDVDGMLSKEIGLTSGIVVPVGGVDGKGRLN